jgi:isoleucyl-tRNA synthetase
LDQTRGWFYTLLVLGTALFDKVPYKNVIVNGLVLAEDGRKMAKKLKNYPDLMDTINKYGADSIRYLLLSSPLVKAEDFNFSEKAVDEVYKKIVLKLENIFSLYNLYNDQIPNNPKETVLDSWIISKIVELSNSVSFYMDRFELDKATRPIMDLIDDFSVWYIRRSRERFKSDDLSEKDSALFYTNFVLKELSKIIAPFMPFLAESLYQRLKGDEDPLSVHLCSWPVYQKEIDKNLLDEMSLAREVVSKVLMQRDTALIKVRQPLSLLKINTTFRNEILEIIKDEVNVKEIKIDESLDQIFLDTKLTDELIKEGMVREFIRAVQDGRKKKNLVAKDSIKLSVSCDQSIKNILLNSQDLIKKVVGALEVEFKESSQLEFPLNLKESSLSFGIEVL